jgi:hypothetical protein
MVRDLGAVCDVSVLVGLASIEKAEMLLDRAELYLPSATYSWLARDKLISVRRKTVSYSVVSKLVRDRRLIAVYLPELYDELARRLLFAVERQVPLTDLRAAMLAAHLRLPLLTFDGELMDELYDHLDARTVWQLEAHGRSMRRALDLYREFSSHVGDYLDQRSGEEGAFEDALEELRKRWKGDLEAATAAEEVGQAEQNPGRLSFVCLAWDLTPILREYAEQHVLQPEVLRELLERMLLLVATQR